MKTIERIIQRIAPDVEPARAGGTYLVQCRWSWGRGAMSYKQATRSHRKRQRPARFARGEWMTSVSFRDHSEVDIAMLQLVARLVQAMPMREVALVLGTSKSTVSKMWRVWHTSGRSQ